MLGLNGGIGGTGFNTTPGTDPGQINQSYKQNQGAMDAQKNLLGALQQQNGLQNQSNVYNQLQGVVNGQGPNPAQAQLAQATGANVANQAALMAGQRGAGANAGLMARQAAQQGGALQQQAAGQGATMQAQQSMNALGQAGEMAGQMAGNQIGQTNANTSAQQNEQGLLQNANNANNSIQGQMAGQQMQGQQKLLGGVGNAVGAMTGLFAAGGAVNMAAGGAFGPQSMFAQSMSGAPQTAPSMNLGAGEDPFKDWGKGKKAAAPAPLGKDPGELSGGITGAAPNALTSGSAVSGGDAFSGSEPTKMPNMVAAGGGKVPAMVSAGEKFLKPNEAKAVADGKASPMKVGETIPGKAKVKGDSYDNDTIPKKLETGGVVIPRSVMQSKDPAKGAAEFVRAVMAKKKVKA